MKRIAEGVFVAEPGVVYFMKDDVALLEHEAPLTQKRRARILAHAPEDKLHEMLIAFCADSWNPPHAHEKVESMLVLKGVMSVKFPDNGPPSEYTTLELHPGDFLRIPPGVVHQPLPLTDCVVMETAEK